MQTIKILEQPVTLPELRTLAEETYASLLKGSADVELHRVAVGGEWHIDSCEVLTSSGSHKDTVWGFNIVFTEDPERSYMLEYHSLINIKPTKNHRAMEITDSVLQDKIKNLVASRILL